MDTTAVTETYCGFEIRLVYRHGWWQTWINGKRFGQISQREEELWRLAKEEIARQLGCQSQNSNTLNL